MGDVREAGYYPTNWKPDYSRMVLLNDLSGLDVEAVAEVCPICNGTGTMVNPNIDAHGISPGEFAEDPDFADEYHRGAYDMVCSGCRGYRVVLIPVNVDDKTEFEGCKREDAAYRAEVAAERRMGA